MPSKMAWQIRFYHSAAWKRKRGYILLRDRYLCREHLLRGQRVAAELVHHIRHLDEHPELALVDSNLESLCTLCHERKHNRKTREQALPPNGIRIIKA